MDTLQLKFLFVEESSNKNETCLGLRGSRISGVLSSSSRRVSQISISCPFDVRVLRLYLNLLLKAPSIESTLSNSLESFVFCSKRFFVPVFVIFRSLSLASTKQKNTYAFVRFKV